MLEYVVVDVDYSAGPTFPKQPDRQKLVTLPANFTREAVGDEFLRLGQGFSDYFGSPEVGKVMQEI